MSDSRSWTHLRLYFSTLVKSLGVRVGPSSALHVNTPHYVHIRMRPWPDRSRHPPHPPPPANWVLIVFESVHGRTRHGGGGGLCGLPPVCVWGRNVRRAFPQCVSSPCPVCFDLCNRILQLWPIWSPSARICLLVSLLVLVFFLFFLSIFPLPLPPP